MTQIGRTSRHLRRPPLAGTLALCITLCAPAVISAQAVPGRDTGAPTDLLACPIQQTPVRAGARPDLALLRKVLRCRKGETVVAPGEEGAVFVDVTTMLVGRPRPWSYRQDIGDGRLGTTVYPVRVGYAVRTYYRAATEVSEGWIRLVNFYVDGFGEWRIGSEESIRGGTFRRIPRT